MTDNFHRHPSPSKQNYVNKLQKITETRDMTGSHVNALRWVIKSPFEIHLWRVSVHNALDLRILLLGHTVYSRLIWCTGRSIWRASIVLVKLHTRSIKHKGGELLTHDIQLERQTFAVTLCGKTRRKCLSDWHIIHLIRLRRDEGAKFYFLMGIF